MRKDRDFSTHVLRRVPVRPFPNDSDGRTTLSLRFSFRTDSPEVSGPCVRGTPFHQFRSLRGSDSYRSPTADRLRNRIARTRTLTYFIVKYVRDNHISSSVRLSRASSPKPYDTNSAAFRVPADVRGTRSVISALRSG